MCVLATDEDYLSFVAALEDPVKPPEVTLETLRKYEFVQGIVVILTLIKLLQPYSQKSQRRRPCWRHCKNRNKLPKKRRLR